MEPDKTMDGQTDRPTEQTQTTEEPDGPSTNETNAQTADQPTGGQGGMTTDNTGQGTNSHLERLRNHYGDFSTADSPPMDWSQDEDTWQWGDEEEAEGGEEGEAGELAPLVIIVIVMIIVIAGNR